MKKLIVSVSLMVVVVCLMATQGSCQLKDYTFSVGNGYTLSVGAYEYPATERIGDTIYLRNCNYQTNLYLSPLNSNMTMKFNGMNPVTYGTAFFVKNVGIYDIYDNNIKIATIKLKEEDGSNYIDAILVDVAGKELPSIIGIDYLKATNVYVAGKFKKTDEIVKCELLNNRFPIYQNNSYVYYNPSNFKNGDSLYYNFDRLQFNCIPLVCTSVKRYSKKYYLIDNILNVQDESLPNLNVFLNDNKTILFVSNMSISFLGSSAEILNVEGQLVKSFQIQNENNISNLPSGGYILLLQLPSGKLYTKRFVK